MPLIDGQVHPTVLIEDDPLFLQQGSLKCTLDAPFGGTDASLGVQYPVPRNIWTGGCAHGPPNSARSTGLPEQACNLPVGGDPAPWYLSHQAVDAIEE